MSKRRTVLVTMLASVLSAAHAGNITITEHTTDPFNNFKRGTETIATGEMEYQPVALLHDRELHVLDACGSVFPLVKDVYGERTLGQPLLRAGAMEDVRPLTGGVQRKIGRDAKGAWHGYTLDNHRYHLNGDGEKVLYQAMSNTEAVHGFRVIDTSVGFGLRPDNRLVAIRLNSAHLAGLGLVQGEDWSGTDVMLYDNYVHEFPTGMERRLFSAHSDGTLHVTALDRDGDKWRVRGREAIAAGKTFSRTVSLVRSEASRAEQWLVRIDDKGRATRVNMSTGDEVLLAKNVPAMGALRESTSVFTLSTEGGFRKDCPVKAVAAAKEEEGFTGDAKRVVELDQELKRLYDAHSREVSEFIRMSLPQVTSEMDGQALEREFLPVLRKVEKFEREIINPIRAAYNGLAEFGGEEWKVRETINKLTNRKHEMSGAYYNFTQELEDYDRFRLRIGERILADARIKFMVAESQREADKAARLYLNAMPFAEWTLKFDPDNEEAKGFLATARQRASTAIAEEKRRIAEARWPAGKEGSFRGPGNARKLMQEALDHFNEKVERAEHEQGARYFAINMREDHWRPGRTNILGEILAYELWLTVARTMPNEPWFAEVCAIEIGTLEAIKQPPFSGVSWAGCQKTPLERVTPWDKNLLEESLKLIRQNTGLSPGDMPAGAMNPDITL